MLESSNFHDRLVESACGHDDLVDGCNDREHRRHLALDILIWIMAIQMNDAKKEGLERDFLLICSRTSYFVNPEQRTSIVPPIKF